MLPGKELFPAECDDHPAEEEPDEHKYVWENFFNHFRTYRIGKIVIIFSEALGLRPIKENR